MLKIIVLSIGIIVLALVVIVALQPGEFRVERSSSVGAPPLAVFAQVNDFHRWEGWNPWGKIDPAMKQSYDGAPAGVGAIYNWNGNSEVGAGRMTITESRPSDYVKIKLEFFKPFAATNTAEFMFKPDGNHTIVTWSMLGEKNFMAKAIHLFMDMDKMIGGQFEKGLANIKSLVETAPGR